MKMAKILKRKSFWIVAVLIIIIIAGYFVFSNKKSNTSIQTGFAKEQNLQETVLSTGQVVSGTDLSLSFQGSGVARKISVGEGDKVYQGQLLASLDQSSALATLASAHGALAQAQANYSKLLSGPSAGDIQALKDAVIVAQTNLDNTYNGALNVLNISYATIYNTYASVTSAQYSYFNMNDQEGILVRDNKNNIANKMADARAFIDQVNGNNNINSAISNLLSDLNSVFESLQIIRNQCDQGIYYAKVSATDRTALDTQKTATTTAITNVNTLQNSIALYRASLQTAENALSAKQAKPRQEDIDLAKAQILSAQGQVDSAQAILNNLIITAPVAGTITEVNIKVGEQAVATKSAIVLQDVGNLRAETNVSEANIASLQIGQVIDYTFDALGADQHFSGKILTINPASTVISGVVNYKVKSSLDNILNIKPGMTVNMTILVASKDNALAVPSTAVINKDNKQFVRVIDDQKNKTYHEVPVQTGLNADGGLVEIISGISADQEIVTYIKP